MAIHLRMTGEPPWLPGLDDLTDCNFILYKYGQIQANIEFPRNFEIW